MHTADVSSYFQPGGSLSRILPGYEHRPQQLELAAGIERALRQGEIGIFEAGTGTGKSFAYLIPAARFAIERGRPVVVSTYTISLQEQLVNKDIPVVRRLFPELRAVLVKGWSNYICRLRLDAALRSPGELIDASIGDSLLRLAAWAESTSDGTRSDLSFEPPPSLWEEVCAESDGCLKADCPHYSGCPIFRDRMAMVGAHLLIVNHHLLFADLAVRRELGWETEQAVLPGYDAVVLDEAHHVEDAAGEYLGRALSSAGVAQLFSRLQRQRQGRRSGVLPAIEAALERRLGDEACEEALVTLRTESAGILHSAHGAVGRFLESAGSFAAPQGDAARDASAFRITPELKAEWLGRVAGPAGEAAALVDRLAGQLQHFRKLLEEGEDGPDHALLARIDAARRRLSNLSRALGEFTDLDFENLVYWIERAPKAASPARLVSAPIDVGPHVLEWIEHQCEALVLTSATLAVNGSFEYTRRRLGLWGASEIAGRLSVRERLIESPFDYGERAVLGLVSDLPDPNERAFREELPEALFHLVTASDGRALVLFTSYALLAAAERALRDRLEALGFALFVQGEAPRSRILARFREGGRSILFGTDSFWEGVDVPGDALSLVIVTRLPFDVPTDPLASARAERIRSRGGSPFHEYTLPRAALKLKQGFGRLIRTQSDRGAVVLCDRRAQTKPYGKYFLDSLPKCRLVTGAARRVADEVRRFLSDRIPSPPAT